MILADGPACNCRPSSQRPEGLPVGRAQVKLKGFKSPDTCHWPGPPSLASFPASRHFPVPWQALGQELNTAALPVFQSSHTEIGPRHHLVPLLGAGGGTGLVTSPQPSQGVQHSQALSLLWEQGLGCCCCRDVPGDPSGQGRFLADPGISQEPQHLPSAGDVNPFPREGKGLQGGERPLRASIPPLPSSPSKRRLWGLVTLPYIYYANPQGLS